MAINANAGRFFPTQTVNLGSNTDPRKFNQSTLPLDLPQNPGSSTTYGFTGQLGCVMEWQGALYRLVKAFATNTAFIDGGVAYWKDKANYLVTAKATESEGGADCVAGGTHVAISTDTASHYIFVQCGGDQAAVVVAASTVAGDHMTGHASNDNVLTRTAAGTAAVDLQAATALSSRGTTTSDNGASVSNSSKVRWIAGNLL